MRGTGPTAPTSGPQFRKGARRSVEVCCAIWIDLLAYRRQIAASSFNPLQPEAKEAIARIDRFHSIVAKHSHRNFPTFAMNDGAVVYRDLSPRSGSVCGDLLMRAWGLFQSICEDEQANNHVGARMIVAAGFRARRPTLYAETSSHADSIWRRYREGLLSPERAITEALLTRRYFDIVPELQANFALTRAYLADQKGTANGLPGPAAYIDSALLPDLLPNWISVGGAIDWCTPEGDMRTTFRRIIHVSREAGPPKEAFAGFDAVSVGRRLSGDGAVGSKLHKARVKQLIRAPRPAHD